MTSMVKIEPIERATGQRWESWLEFMSSIDAEQLDHAAIARRVEEQLHGVVENPGWWAQGITVAWEQQSGRRLPGQRADGTFQASVSRTTRFDMRGLADAWSRFAASDHGVLAQITGEPRLSGTEKRINWRASSSVGGTITVTSELRKGGGAALVVQIAGNPSRESNVAARSAWTEIVGRFVAAVDC